MCVPLTPHECLCVPRNLDLPRAEVVGELLGELAPQVCLELPPLVGLWPVPVTRARAGSARVGVGEGGSPCVWLLWVAEPQSRKRLPEPGRDAAASAGEPRELGCCGSGGHIWP